MSNRRKLKPLPRLKSDAAAERFMETADLSQHDLSDFRAAHFEFEKRGNQVKPHVTPRKK